VSRIPNHLMGFHCSRHILSGILVFSVHYCFQNIIEKDMLCCRPREGHTVGEDIVTFRKISGSRPDDVNDFFFQFS
jgi:hypothetical protein